MLESSPKSNTIKLNHSTVIMRDDGILELQCGADTYYEMSHLKELIDSYEKLGKGKKIPILHIVGPYTSIAPDARTWGGTEEASVYSLAEAYVLKSLAQKLLANFYLKFDSPTVPTKFFNSVHAAEEWLRTFL